MPDLLRRLSPRGVAAFREYLESLRAGKTAPPRLELVDGSAFTELASPTATVERRSFHNRLDAARYLSGVLGDDADIEDVGLWGWLSLYYIDEVCPLGTNGTRAPGRDYRHLLESGYRYGHRHLLAGPYAVYCLHGDAARLLLCSSVHQESSFHHELATRQALISNRAIIDTADRLYYDAAQGRSKRGAQSARAGALLRLIDVLLQLDVNYDLYSMSAHAIIELLPAEFEPWISAAKESLQAAGSC